MAQKDFENNVNIRINITHGVIDNVVINQSMPNHYISTEYARQKNGVYIVVTKGSDGRTDLLVMEDGILLHAAKGTVKVEPSELKNILIRYDLSKATIEIKGSDLKGVDYKNQSQIDYNQILDNNIAIYEYQNEKTKNTDPTYIAPKPKTNDPTLMKTR